MVGPRIKITKALIDHGVQLGEELDDVSLGISMVRIKIMAGTVATRSPIYPQSFLAQNVAGLDQVARVAKFKCEMEESRTRTGQEVDRMMISIAPQENKDVFNPIGHAEAEIIDVEALGSLRLSSTECNMSQLLRRNAMDREMEVAWGFFAIQIKAVAVRIDDLYRVLYTI